METKQTPPVGLPTFNDPNRYGEQIITQGQFPESGMSSGGGETEIQSFDFPEPDTGTPSASKPSNPAKQARKKGKETRRNIRQTARAKNIDINNFEKEQKLRQRKGMMLPINTLPSPKIASPVNPPTAPSLTESPFDMMNQQYDQQSPQGTVPMQNLMPDQTAMSYQPPMPGNTQGTAKPLFNQGTANVAQQIYGSEEQRQQSVPGAPLYMHKGEPHAKRSLETYEREKIRNSIDGDDASLFGKVKKILFKPTNQGVRVSDITKRSYDNFKEKIDPIGRYITEYPNKYL